MKNAKDLMNNAAKRSRAATHQLANSPTCGEQVDFQQRHVIMDYLTSERNPI